MCTRQCKTALFGTQSWHAGKPIFIQAIQQSIQNLQFNSIFDMTSFKQGLQLSRSCAPRKSLEKGN